MRSIAKIAPPMAPPSPDSPNACTDEMTPERVRKVPNRQRMNVVTTITKPSRRSRPVFQWVIVVWSRAVPVSQGRRLAFSTGSQPQ